MKKKISVIISLALVCTCFLLASCAKNTSQKDSKNEKTNLPISVISREEGSGTRGAFIELFEIEEKDENGNKTDRTTESAEITNNTAVMLSTVSQNKNAIGYVSLGSLNDSVKALKIDGAEPTVENVKSGAYKISRPFNIATKKELSKEAEDFISYIMSADGQKIVEEAGYIKKDIQNVYSPANNLSGKIVVAGSSSVSPVMEKLAEGYMAINKGVTIQIQTSDSTTGMTSAADGVCDIGMASRELKDSEKEKGLISQEIAGDGIAVIVNKENVLNDISSENVKKIYTGEITDFSEVK